MGILDIIITQLQLNMNVTVGLKTKLKNTTAKFNPLKAVKGKPTTTTTMDFSGNGIAIDTVETVVDYPLYQRNLALTSPTSGGGSVGVVGIVRLRTKATELLLLRCEPWFQSSFVSP
jgi:hypothetical protein